MKAAERLSPLPIPTIRRYPIYLREIAAMTVHGESHVSSAVIADRLGLDPVLTRKDLAMAGVTGKPRLGYPAKALAAALTRALGWDSPTDALLVGAGSLGQALLGYTGFRKYSLSIGLAFDIDPEKIGRAVHGVDVYPIDKMAEVVRDRKLKIGILTVPAEAAQVCADALVASGIVGIWNFTPVQLAVPPGVIVQNIDLAQSLAVLTHEIACS